MSDTIITITMHQNHGGDSFYIAHLDGVNYTTLNGAAWLGPLGSEPKDEYRLREAFRDYLLDQADEEQTHGDGDPLTPNERAAMNGAIADARAGLAVGLSALTKRREKVLYEERENIMQDMLSFQSDDPIKGVVLLGLSLPKNWPMQDVVWDTRTGERTIIDHKEVAWSRAYSGPISNWERGAAYKSEDGSIIVLHEFYDKQDFFVQRNGRADQLYITEVDDKFYRIPGSTGCLIPEIIKDH